MALIASFQRKFDALKCTVDITYSIRLNKKIWGRIKCRQKRFYNKIYNKFLAGRAKYILNQEVIKDILSF